MYKHILVPVSFIAEPEFTKLSLQTAVDLIDRDGGLLRVVNVMPGYGSPLVAGHFPEPNPSKMKATLYDRLHNLVSPLVPDEVNVKLKLLDGVPHKAILHEVKRVEPDLVVIASNTKRSVERLFLGSVAARVVERSMCSVLVVRPSVK